MYQSFQTRRRSVLSNRRSSELSSLTSSSTHSQPPIWTNKGHLRYRKWRALVSQARTTFLDEDNAATRAEPTTSKLKLDGDRNEEVRICVDKWRTTLVEIKERRPNFKPLECFRRIVRIVRTILRVANALKCDPKRDLGEGICKSFLAVVEGYMMMKNKTFVTNLRADTGPGLFDPSLFKANKEVQISKEVRNILSLRRDERTAEQLQTLLYACQTLSAFAELPIHMQESICKVAWNQSLPENKIILKQGHLPENFYFIMSGSVTVLSESDPSKDSLFTSLATLRRGISFGETAILRRCRRTATVVTKDPVQLLVISREDYQRIFMGRSKKGEEPRHIKFCRTLDFLAGFPVDLLIDNQSRCMFHYFRRGSVIVKDDSRDSEWIYIVVSGMCEVMLNLEAVKPKLTGKQIDAEVSPVEMQAYLTVGRFCRSQYAYSSVGKRRTGWDKTIPRDGPSSSTNITNEVSPITSLPQRRGQTVKTALSESTLSSVSLSSISEELNRNQSSINTPVYPSTSLTKKKSKQTKKPVFVRIDFLHPRSVFGLSNLDLDNTGAPKRESASVSLVSRGAECVMISKKFFVAHAREPTKRWIRHNVLPYPTKDILQKNLQQKVNWNAYKSEIVKKVKAV